MFFYLMGWEGSRPLDREAFTLRFTSARGATMFIGTVASGFTILAAGVLGFHALLRLCSPCSVGILAISTTTGTLINGA